jgi:methylenetetrahydrofolate/methylenetetrahydromethanopterin dehydrogenase (NADP+)
VTLLAATGSVGRRAVRLLAREGASVRVASRQLRRAQEVCDSIRAAVPNAKLTAWETRDDASLRAALEDAVAVIAAGAPAVELLSEKLRRDAGSLKVAIDLNAVPPVGIGGIEPHDKAIERDGVICFGAIGVGGTKMKLHKAAIQNDLTGGVGRPRLKAALVSSDRAMVGVGFWCTRPAYASGQRTSMKSGK